MHGAAVGIQDSGCFFFASQLFGILAFEKLIGLQLVGPALFHKRGVHGRQ
jgi:hypothetical protein